MGYYTDFEYAGEKLSDYGMMVCNFDRASGIETISSGADIKFNQVNPSGNNRFYIASSTYDSVYSTVFQICKNPSMFNSQDDMYLEPDLVSTLQRFLCRKNEYHKFKVNQENFEHIHWQVTFSSKQITINRRVVGLELTLFTDSPFAYMDKVSAEYNCLAGTSFNLWDNSDEITDINNQIYPDMEITILSKGDFELENSMDNKIMKFSGCNVGEIITINGKNEIISSSIPSHNIPDNFNFFFPRIVNTYDNRCNTFTPNLDCKIKISYYPIRKIGL